MKQLETLFWEKGYRNHNGKKIAHTKMCIRDRINSVANPRQIERVVPGTSFGVNIVYEFSGEREAQEDLALLAKGMLSLIHI